LSSPVPSWQWRKASDVLQAARGASAARNPWCAEAVAVRGASRGRLADAYELAGNHGRAIDVRGCGACELALLEGAPLVAQSGVPVARVSRCGARLCPDCAADAARRNRRTLTRRMAQASALRDTARDAQAAAAAAALAVARLERLSLVRGGYAAAVDHLLREAGTLPGWTVRRAIVEAGGAPSPSPLPSLRLTCRAPYTWEVAQEAKAYAEAHAARRRLRRALKALAAKAALRKARWWLAFAEGMAASYTGPDATPRLHHREALRLWAWDSRDDVPEDRAAAASARILARARARAHRRAEREHSRDLRALSLGLLAAQAAVARAERRAARAGVVEARSWLFVTFAPPPLPLHRRATLTEALNVVDGAVSRLVRSQEWRGRVAAACVRTEVERSTPHTRKRKADALAEQAETLRAAGLVGVAEAKDRAVARLLTSGAERRWHAHAHAVVSAVGARWPVAELHRAWVVALNPWTWRKVAPMARWRLRRGSVAARPPWAPRAPLERLPRPPLDGRRGLCLAPPPAAVPAWRVEDARRWTEWAATATRPHIERAKTQRGVAAEVSKYITKPARFAGLSPAELAELVTALHGRRTLRTSGALRGAWLVEESAPAVVVEGAEDATAGILARRGDGTAVATDDVEWCNMPALVEWRRETMERLHDQHKEARRSQREAQPVASIPGHPHRGGAGQQRQR